MMTPLRLGLLTTIAVTAAFIWFIAQIPAVTGGSVLTFRAAWVPFLDVAFTLRLDGLALLFAILITGVGVIIGVYSLAYMEQKPETRRYWVHLALFTLSMLGTVVAGDLITMYVFWELTAITSFLLIGYERKKEGARFAAWQALLITVAGGLTMLGGITLLPVVTGTYDLTPILTMGTTVRGHALYPVLLGLFLVGAFTKSCQVPVHFWLPGAMVAPTPISAFLHSATMVKAGVYLLARLHPVFGGTEAWSISLAAVGGATALVGAVLALRQTDLKLVLAYSTVTALGTIVLLLSDDGVASVTAAMVFLVAHALYKSTLFLITGIVDRGTGTRQLARLGNLRSAMPLSAIAAVGAGLSMAGIPPFAGCLSKEGIYAATLGMAWPVLATIGLLVASAIMTATAGIVVLGPFFRPASEDAVTGPEGAATLWGGPVLLAVLGLVVGVAPGLIDPLISAAASSVLGRPVSVHLSLWHGIGMPLALGIMTLALGAGLYLARRPARDWLGTQARWLPVQGTRLFRSLVDALLIFAAWLGHRLQTGILRHYLAVVFTTASGLVGGTLLLYGAWPALPPWPDLHFYEWAVASLAAISAFTVAVTHSRLLAVCALGVAGASVALLFVMYGAPDVAMTQLMVEILIVVILTQVILRLPLFEQTRALVRDQPYRHLAVAGLAGGVTTVLVLMATAGSLDPKLADYFIDHALTEAYGRNVVNVILVDFRGLDTLGEITVLGIAGMAGYALVKVRHAWHARKEKP